MDKKIIALAGMIAVGLIIWAATGPNPKEIYEKTFDSLEEKAAGGNDASADSMEHPGWADFFTERLEALKPAAIKETLDGLIPDTQIADTKEDAEQEQKNTCNSYLEVHYIDVGQGDCTLITCEGHAMLIDCGTEDKGTLIQNYLNNQGIYTLDFLVLTHNDADHIGGAPVIITKYDIATVYMSYRESTTRTYEKVEDALQYRSYQKITPKAGDKAMLGSAEITILAPIRDDYEDINDTSIVLMLQYGNNRFIFTGDAEETAEGDMLNSGSSLQADVYKVGHHGSSTSSSPSFVDSINPSYAVISCGQDNEYGHPSAGTLNTLRQKGVQVFRTDEQGSIIASSDGNSITWNCAPSDTWKAGEYQ